MTRQTLKTLWIAAYGFLVTIIIICVVLLCGCSSDINPVDRLNVSKEESVMTPVTIDFSVADTRSATEEENAISQVSLYVFADNGTLEQVLPDLSVSNNRVKPEVPSGQKTIYAISAAGNSLITGVTKGTTTLTEFKEKTLAVSESALHTANGFVMVGNGSINITTSTSQFNSSNRITINMTRLLAKVLLTCGSYDLMNLGMDWAKNGYAVIPAAYAPSQLNSKMRLTPNTSDLVDFNEASNTNGTYAGYSTSSPEYIDVYNSYSYNIENATSAYWLYIPENIVTSPTSGNTTFLTLRVPAVPLRYYTYNTNTLSYNSNSTPATFYAVALVDAEHGYVDYAIDTDKNYNKLICFNNQTQAQNYAAAINNGSVSVKTFSDISPASAPAAFGATRSASCFEVVTFTDGYMYYRINIKDTDADKCQIKRNTYYRITVNSFNTMGMPTEALLVPTDPATSLDYAPVPSAWLDATCTAVEWTADNQSITL